MSLHGCECLWLILSMQPRTKRSFTISLIHRYLEKIHQFIEDYLQCLHELAKDRKNFYILDDLNISISESNRSPQVINYRNAPGCNGSSHLIFKPFRITDIVQQL